jgi:hypothetical protein
VYSTTHLPQPTASSYREDGSGEVTVTQRVAVGARAAELAGLGGSDYADAFTVHARADRPAEDLARLAMDGAPIALRLLVRVAQQGVLRLRLAPWRSRAHVIGWTVRVSRPDAVLLVPTDPC